LAHLVHCTLQQNEVVTYIVLYINVVDFIYLTVLAYLQICDVVNFDVYCV